MILTRAAKSPTYHLLVVRPGNVYGQLGVGNGNKVTVVFGHGERTLGATRAQASQENATVDTGERSR